MSWSEPYPWAAAVAFCAALAIWGKAPERLAVHYIFKPLTTALIFAVAALMVAPSTSRHWLLIALVLCGIGDVLLMLSQRFFVGGLVAFLLGHVALIVAFTLQIPLAPRQLLYAILPAAVAALILSGMWPKLGRYRGPVALYVAVLATMAWRALSRFDALDVSLRHWLYGCVGAALFMTSDTLLARRRFLHKPVRYAVELGTYFAALWCLVAGMS